MNRKEVKRIKPEDLPEFPSEEMFAALVEMALEFPKRTFDWAEISAVLEERGQLHIVLDRIEEIRKQSENVRREAMTEGERKEEAAKWEKIKSDPNPHKFYGNMGQPETPQEFKSRYGVWPPGYDEDGNRVSSNKDK